MGCSSKTETPEEKAYNEAWHAGYGYGFVGGSLLTFLLTTGLFLLIGLYY